MPLYSVLYTYVPRKHPEKNESWWSLQASFHLSPFVWNYCTHLFVNHDISLMDSGCLCFEIRCKWLTQKPGALVTSDKRFVCFSSFYFRLLRPMRRCVQRCRDLPEQGSGVVLNVWCGSRYREFYNARYVSFAWDFIAVWMHIFPNEVMKVLLSFSSLVL